MATEAKRQTGTRDSGRVRYRFTGEQVLRMIDAGIIPGDVDVELWNGVVYQMTKYEPHNYVVMVTAEALRRVVSVDYHVREEKSSQYGEHSLPEPDVAVARGALRSYVTTPPPLERMALLVEVCHTTDRADRGQKLRGYAKAGVPVYWIIDVARRCIEVYHTPDSSVGQTRYREMTTYLPGQDLPVVLDGREVARFTVADLLPPETAV
jgi:Uma2 family endonuclease